MYTILYMNDTVCNHIRFLSKDIPNKDKYTKKLYRALENRVYNYFSNIRRIIGEENLDFFSEYCSNIDSIIDDLIQNYSQSIEQCYKDNGIEDYKYFSKIETIRSLSELSLIAGKRLIEKTKEIMEKAGVLEHYLLKEVDRIVQDLANHTYRHVTTKIDLNQYSNIIDDLNKVYSELINYQNFETAYISAGDYEQNRRRSSTQSFR